MDGDGLVAEGGQGKRRKRREQGVVVTVLERLEEGADREEEDGEGGKGKKKRGFRIAWTSTGWSHWQLHSERVMEFLETDDGGTEYVCWETFAGVLASVVKRVVGAQLVDRFGDYARDVKGFLESRKKGEEDGLAGGG